VVDASPFHLSFTLVRPSQEANADTGHAGTENTGRVQQRCRTVLVNQIGRGSVTYCERCDFRYGSRLCENSDVELARRISVSISSIRKPIALATSVGRRQLRKQFCVSLAHATFHTAWVKNGSVRARAARPFYPQEQISSARLGVSVWCQQQTKKAATFDAVWRFGGHHTHPYVSGSDVKNVL
jgi:hypothetical protein